MTLPELRKLILPHVPEGWCLFIDCTVIDYGHRPDDDPTVKWQVNVQSPSDSSQPSWIISGAVSAANCWDQFISQYPPRISKLTDANVDDADLSDMVDDIAELVAK